MDKMMQIYDMLERELEEFAKRGELTSSSLSAIEKITHSMKSLSAVMAMEGSSQASGNYSGGRSGYSGRYPARGYSGEYSNENSQRGYSNNRGYSNEYSGNYSNNYSGNSLRDHLEQAMMSAPDERTRKEIERLMSRM